jgi:hypothetical protein
MRKFWFSLLFVIVVSGLPTFAQNQPLSISSGLNFHSEPFLGLQNDLRSADKGTSNFKIKYNTVYSVSQLALNYDGYSNFNLDGSYFQYTNGIATYGVGAVNRNWSFSGRTSLILSHNARPSKSIYIKLKNEFDRDWLSTEANWSFEIFNGIIKGALNNSKSMLLGLRATLTPIKGLNFEIVQTSQWGGKGYNSDISALGAAILFDTNESSNSNINKMSGFGVSYSIPSNTIPLRIYGQAIGEDEAGNLPSCYGYLAGIEWTNAKIKHQTTVGIEAIDTRVDKTANGNCGANTMYNNNTYAYANYGSNMGAAIGTEGTSLELFIKSQISQKINIDYSTKFLTINDKNWYEHQLSSKRETGLMNSLGISWYKNNLKFNINVYNQGYILNKSNIKNSSGIGFSSSIKF